MILPQYILAFRNKRVLGSFLSPKIEKPSVRLPSSCPKVSRTNGKKFGHVLCQKY